MKKILVRTGFTPFENIKIEDMLARSLMGGNIGNSIYAYSIFRTLMTSKDVEFVPTRYRQRLRDTDEINETCSHYIIPLADMFRVQDNSIPHMEQMAKFIRKLKIPCTIVGVGVRAPVDSTLKEDFPFNPAVKELVSAVLEKSDMIGVRGERTGQYLSNLGFIEGKHFQVIGCPSMYAFGDTLYPDRSMDSFDLNLTKDSKISLNASSLSTDRAIRFLDKVRKEHKNHYFLPQREAELWLLYAGLTSDKLTKSPVYPMNIEAEVYQQDRVKYFLHPQAWMNYLRDMDFSVGCRLHGNVAAIQAGIPALFIVHDSRMLELARYHKLPHVMADQIDPEISLEELIPQVDFTSMRKQQKENFDRYCSFLDANGIDHIYRHYGMNDKVPFDDAMNKMQLPESISSVIHCSQREQAERFSRIFEARKKWDSYRIEDEKEFFRGIAASTRNRLQEKINMKNEELKILKQQYNALNNTTIKADVKQIGRKLIEKAKGDMGDNYSRISR